MYGQEQRGASNCQTHQACHEKAVNQSAFLPSSIPDLGIPSCNVTIIQHHLVYSTNLFYHVGGIYYKLHITRSSPLIIPHEGSQMALLPHLSAHHTPPNVDNNDKHERSPASLLLFSLFPAITNRNALALPLLNILPNTKPAPPHSLH
jgi:hypothetical protein